MDRSETITATLFDSANNPIPDALITWSWDAGNIAGIETNGNSITVYPISSGTVVVTAEYGKINSSAIITVGAKAISSEINARGIVLPNTSILLSPGITQTIKVHPIPGGLEDSMAFSWTSSDLEIAEVEGSGREIQIKANKEGDAVITVSTLNPSPISDSISVKVKPTIKDEVSSISLSSQSILFDMAKKVLTTVDATPIINGEQGKETITWSLSDLSEDSLSLLPISEDGGRIAVAKKGEGKGYLIATAPNGVSSNRYK